MDSLRKTRDILSDIVELYIPALAFIIMFVMFVVQIFFRYVLRSPIDMAYEITVSCYLWLVILGACYAQRSRSHVVFTLLTDKMPMRLQAFCTFMGSFLIAFAFIWSFVPTVEFVDFMARQKTSVLKIGMNVVYAPYLVFLVLMIVYMIRDMILDFKVFIGLASDADIERYRLNNLNEVDQALESAKEGAIET